MDCPLPRLITGREDLFYKDLTATEPWKILGIGPKGIIPKWPNSFIQVLAFKMFYPLVN